MSNSTWHKLSSQQWAQQWAQQRAQQRAQQVHLSIIKQSERCLV